MKKHDNWIEIARTGVYPGKLSLTRALFERNVSQFAALREARGVPYVLGHPAMDAPAYGWMQEIKVEPNGERGPERGWSLYARGEAHESFFNAVRDGLYKTISIALDPITGLLRHVGFLGAKTPAIDSLPQVNFSDSENIESYELDAERPASDNADFSATTQRTRKMKLRRNPKTGALEMVNDDGSITTIDTAEFSAENSEMEKKLKELEAANKKLAEENAAALFAATVAEERVLIDSLTKEGKLTPAQAAGLGEFMATLPDSKDDSFEFSATDGKSKSSATPRSYMRELLKSLPVQVPLKTEFAKTAAKGAPTAAQFNAGSEADSFDKRVREYAAQHNISYTAAFSALVQKERG